MKKPNIIVFVADQLTWNALPCYGNTYAKTPNIDTLAESGTFFDSCYTPCPLCQPARASFWTSKYPHEIDVLSNGKNYPVSEVTNETPTLGECFNNAGYDTVHFGKKHDAGALRGFTCASEDEIVKPSESGIYVNMDTYADYYTTEKTVEYLQNRKSEKPLLLVTDYVNPHTICGWIGDNKGEHTDKPYNGILPELPDNFDFDDIANRPLPVQYICCSHNRQAQTAGWTRENFRHYLAAYYEYMAMMDKEVGIVLKQLEQSIDMENTLVVFMADHGDSMTSRGRVTKQVDFYEEVTRVPFIFSGKGVKNSKKPIKGLTSLLDLFPTLCDYANIEIPNGLRGESLCASITKGEAPKAEYVLSQWHTEWGFTVSPGRMIVSDGFKYVRYLEQNGEELYDLKNDPYEKTNIAQNANYKTKLEHMQTLLNEAIKQTNDPFENMEYYAAEKWRSHELGYHNHKGDAAPMQPFSKK